MILEASRPEGDVSEERTDRHQEEQGAGACDSIPLTVADYVTND